MCAKLTKKNAKKLDDISSKTTEASRNQKKLFAIVNNLMFNLNISADKANSIAKQAFDVAKPVKFPSAIPSLRNTTTTAIHAKRHVLVSW